MTGTIKNVVVSGGRLDAGPCARRHVSRENQRQDLNTLADPADNTDGTIQKMPRAAAADAGGKP